MGCVKEEDNEQVVVYSLYSTYPGGSRVDISAARYGEPEKCRSLIYSIIFVP